MSEAPGTSLVLGVETQIGLAIVRELGRAGVKVVALSHDPTAIGLRSRYVAERVLFDQPRSSELLAKLRELGRRHGPCSLICVSEANLQWLVEHRGELAPDLRAVLPPPAALRAVLDKQQTLAAAVQVGIAVPRTEEPGSLDALQAIADGFPYPAVLKWKDANAVAPKLDAAGLPFLKAEYVNNAEELRAAGRRYAPLGEWPMIQQYCAGQGLGQFFFMHHGQAVRRFQHLRVAEWPPEGGFSSVCDAVPLAQHRALQAQSVALLQAVGWQGVAMVEYRHDPDTARAVLMEINGRFWGSLPLAVQAGAGFALLSHLAAIGRPLPALPAPRERLRCRMVTTEVKRLLRICLAPQRIQDRHFRIRRGAELARFVRDFFRPDVCYYVWSIDDPWPFLADLANMARRVTRLLSAR